MSRPQVGAYLRIRRLQVGDRSSTLADCQPKKQGGGFTHKPWGRHTHIWLPGDGIDVCSKCGTTRGGISTSDRPADQPITPNEKSILDGMGLTPDAVKQLVAKQPTPIKSPLACFRPKPPSRAQLETIYNQISGDPARKSDLLNLGKGIGFTCMTPCPACREAMRISIHHDFTRGQCSVKGCLDWDSTVL